jgi:hypothetical protein
MARIRISEEALSVSNRAEDLVLITETHMARGNNLRDFEDNEEPPESHDRVDPVRTELNATMRPSRESSFDKVKNAANYRDLVIAQLNREKKDSDQERDLTRMPKNGGKADQVLRKKVEEIQRRKSVEDLFRTSSSFMTSEVVKEEVQSSIGDGYIVTWGQGAFSQSFQCGRRKTRVGGTPDNQGSEGWREKVGSRR